LKLVTELAKLGRLAIFDFLYSPLLWVKLTI
jgi:hypothetical protein